VHQIAWLFNEPHTVSSFSLFFPLHTVFQHPESSSIACCALPAQSIPPLALLQSLNTFRLATSTPKTRPSNGCSHVQLTAQFMIEYCEIEAVTHCKQNCDLAHINMREHTSQHAQIADWRQSKTTKLQGNHAEFCGCAGVHM
jgi:hypothetical protein